VEIFSRRRVHLGQIAQSGAGQLLAQAEGGWVSTFARRAKWVHGA
jgi:hypothetical protein